MTRVIGGRSRGRRLRVPGSGTRPTSDRVRESLFASLESRLLADGKHWQDVALCDAYAGSGAVALEAWSRGAVRVCAIERDKRASAIIESNVEQLGAGSGVTVLTRPVEAVFAAPAAGGPFDIVFVDPPYDLPARRIAGQLDAARAHGWLADGAVVVVERSTREGVDPFPADVGFFDVHERRYGESTLWYGRYAVDEKGSR